MAAALMIRGKGMVCSFQVFRSDKASRVPTRDMTKASCGGTELNGDGRRNGFTGGRRRRRCMANRVLGVVQPRRIEPLLSGAGDERGQCGAGSVGVRLRNQRWRRSGVPTIAAL